MMIVGGINFLKKKRKIEEKTK